MVPQPVCQLLVDPPADGAWNMAVDEALLDDATGSKQATLRLYRWQSPTVSLGYFQKSADMTQHWAGSAADAVRRLSGGGAIVHDHELTYSLILPSTHPLARDTQAIYDAVHRAIIETLDELFVGALPAWQAVLCHPTAKTTNQDEPFLCFQRRAEGDILLRSIGADVDHKIVGSAQRRRRGAVLQHGSILLQKSDLADQILGISEIVQQPISALELIDRLPKILNRHLALGDLFDGSLAEPLITKARLLRDQKYTGPSWLNAR